MDTATFLSHILPRQGFKFIAIKEADDKPWIHKPTESCSIAADIAEQADADLKAVYHACASFKAAYVETGEFYDNGRAKRKYRIEDNAGWVKSFWLDLDCGDGKEYPNQKEAVLDVVRFCKETGLPRPLLVNSGNGVHCYWVLDDAISAAQWKRVATVFRSVADHFKVKHDSVCTTDVCRILRPVGTTNRKRTPKPVTLIGNVPEALDAKVFVSQLMGLVKDHAIDVKQAPPRRPSFLANADLNSDLSAGTEYPPSSAHEIANNCAQVRDFRDSGGDVPEPLWYAMLGLLKHTVEGDAICHDWSKGHSGYDEATTDRKIIQWQQGPTTCAKFEQLNPVGCEGCRFKERCKSPIQLGVVVPESEPVAEVDVDSGEVEVIPEIPEHMSKSFVWHGGFLCQFVRDDDGVMHTEKFSDMYLFPDLYSDTVERKMKVTWRLRERAHRYRTFEIDGSVLGVGGKDLWKILGEHGCVVSGNHKKAMEMYITEWWKTLRSASDAMSAFTTFGWQADNSFLLGDTLFRTDGSEDQVRVQGDAGPYVDAFVPRGTLEQWKADIDFAYNRPEHEQFQWMLGTGFGAPLIKLMGGNMAGCIINGYSPETAQGKSTAGKLALGLYGNPDKLALTKQQATVKGLFAYTGVMRSLPILLDEITNTRGYELSDLVYTFSQGAGRIGANGDGSLRKNVYEWATIMAATSNRGAQSTLAASKVNATPEIARVFEYKFVRAKEQMTKLEADDVVPRLIDNSGHAGRVYLKYIVSNREKVQEVMAKVRIALTKAGGLSQEERFWLSGMTAIISGLSIAKSLDLVKFDIKALMEWSIRQVKVMRTLVGESETNAIDQFGVMLNELSSRFLVTDREGDARTNEGRAIVLHPPRGDLAGRVVTQTQTLYLPISVLRKWCSDNQADYREMVDELVAKQWAVVEHKPLALGKGTNDYATAPSRCYRINLALAGGELAAADKVSLLRVVK